MNEDAIAAKAIKSKKIGFIGLGMMGEALALQTQQSGYAVTLLMRAHHGADYCAELRSCGAQTFATAREMAERCDVIILCVTGSPQVEELVFAEHGLLSALTPGCVVVDCTTSLPESSRRIAAAITAKGGHFLDAAMTGTPMDAKAGTVNLLIGGDAAVLERVRPVLSTFAKNVFLCGAVGAGHSIKLIHQFVVLSNAAVLAEAFSFAKKSEVNLGVLCDVIGSGGAASKAFERLKPYVMEGQDEFFRFSLANALKDMDYYTKMASEAQAVNGIGAAVLQSYTVANNFGLGGKFVPNLVASVDKLNGARSVDNE